MAAVSVLLAWSGVTVLTGLGEDTGVFGIVGWVVAAAFGVIAHRATSVVGLRLVRVGIVLALVAFGTAFVLIFISFQIEDILDEMGPAPGSIDFSLSEGPGCSVGEPTDTFEPGDPIHVAAGLSRSLVPGETFALDVTVDGIPLQTVEQVAYIEADCLGTSEPVVIDMPGVYEFEYRAGDESLARGQFEVLPSLD